MTREPIVILLSIPLKPGRAKENWACNMVADRLDGKPAQESTVNLVHRMDVREYSDDELLELMAKTMPLIEHQTHEGPDSVQ